MSQPFTTNFISISVLFLAAFAAGCIGGRERPAASDTGTGRPDGGATEDAAIEERADVGLTGDAAIDDGGAPDTGSASGAGRGEACTVEACADGLTCASDGTVSVCVGLCDAADYTGCLRTESCNIPLDSAQNACSPSCDLLTTEGCPSGSTCGVFADSTGAVYKGCDSAGTRTQGQDCDAYTKCAPGHVCAYWSSPPHLSGWECLQFCDLDGLDGASCPTGTECAYAPREADPFAEIDRIGACR
jgi:hypothetical protein